MSCRNMVYAVQNEIVIVGYFSASLVYSVTSEFLFCVLGLITDFEMCKLRNVSHSVPGLQNKNKKKSDLRYSFDSPAPGKFALLKYKGDSKIRGHQFTQLISKKVKSSEKNINKKT